MTTAASYTAFVSPEDYLAGEVAAECRHEYLNGMVYAMAGGTQRHSAISVNILATLHAQMRGRPCRPYGSDMLVRVEHGGDLRFYYPDVSIICRPAGPESRVQTQPAVIFEVLSESTARTDTGEKRMAYLTIGTLEAYVLVDSTQRAITVWRRQGETWAHEVFAQPADRLTFINDEYQLLISEIYESTGF